MQQVDKTAPNAAAEPVRKRVRVEAPVTVAFDTFVRMAGWMPASHTLLEKPRAEIVIEPRPGGRWVERGEDGSERDWGKVLVWEPPGRIVLAWQIGANWAFDPDLITEVEVLFSADGDATIVNLEHRHIERMGEGATEVRAALDSDEGWSGDLAGFVELIAKGS